MPNVLESALIKTALCLTFQISVAETTIANNEKLRPLTAVEIQKVLSGKSISPNSSNKLYLPFYEKFYPDRSWTGAIQSVRVKTTNGIWEIEDGKICVTPERGIKECRYLSINETNGAYFIEALSFYRAEKGDLIVNISELY